MTARSDEIRGLLDRATRDDVLVRHRVGRMVRELRAGGDETHGAHAVERLAESLSFSRATLYRYALVAERWSASEAAAIVARARQAGFNLTWSHFVAISSSACPAERDVLVERAIRERLAVRDIARALRARLPSKDGALDRTKDISRKLTEEARRWHGPDAGDESALDALIEVHRTIQATSARHTRALLRARDRLESARLRAPRGESSPPSRQRASAEEETSLPPRRRAS